MTINWKNKKKINNEGTYIKTPTVKRPITDSEEFVLQLGSLLNMVFPNFCEKEELETISKREGLQIGIKILTSMMLGEDHYNIQKLPFDLLIKEYKRLNKLYPNA